MKILIISPSLNYGGAEHVAALWASGFVERGHQVWLATSQKDKVMYQPDERVKVLPLFPDGWGKYSKYFGAVAILRKYLKEYRPDVIIGIQNMDSLLGWLASRGLNIPVIKTEHNAFDWPENVADLSPRQLREKRFVKFHMNKLYSAVTVLTEADRKVIGNRLKRVFVLPNPLAMEPVKEIPHKEKIILAAGRMNAWWYKGFDVLFPAWALIAKNHPDWKLQVAGAGWDGPTKYVHELAQKSGAGDQIEFLGFRKDIVDLYRRSAIFVLSSRYEGFGMVLIEAMSQGCAPVACDFRGRQREIVTSDKEGQVCPPDDPKALAEAMERLIEDDGYRQSVQQTAVERSKYYMVDKCMERWKPILAQITNKK